MGSGHEFLFFRYPVSIKQQKRCTAVLCGGWLEVVLGMIWKCLIGDLIHVKVYFRLYIHCYLVFPPFLLAQFFSPFFYLRFAMIFIITQHLNITYKCCNLIGCRIEMIYCLLFLIKPRRPLQRKEKLHPHHLHHHHRWVMTCPTTAAHDQVIRCPLLSPGHDLQGSDFGSTLPRPTSCADFVCNNNIAPHWLPLSGN